MRTYGRAAMYTTEEIKAILGKWVGKDCIMTHEYYGNVLLVYFENKYKAYSAKFKNHPDWPFAQVIQPYETACNLEELDGDNWQWRTSGIWGDMTAKNEVLFTIEF